MTQPVDAHSLESCILQLHVEQALATLKTCTNRDVSFDDIVEAIRQYDEERASNTCRTTIHIDNGEVILLKNFIYGNQVISCEVKAPKGSCAKQIAVYPVIRVDSRGFHVIKIEGKRV